MFVVSSWSKAQLNSAGKNWNPTRRPLGPVVVHPFVTARRAPCRGVRQPSPLKFKFVCAVPIAA